MASAFTPPPLDSHQGPAPFTPPPLSSHQGPATNEEVRLPKSAMDHIKNFAENFWGDLSNTGQGMVNAVAHPVETVKGIGRAQDELRLKSQAAFERFYKGGSPGDYAEGVRHFLGWIMPIVGPAIDARGDQAQSGDVSGALGGATSIGLQLAGPGVLKANAPAIVPALETAAAATKGAVQGAVRGAVEPINYGRLKIPVPASVAGAGAGGYVAGQVGLPHQVGAVVGAATPIIRGAIRGMKASLAERSGSVPGKTAVSVSAMTPGQVLAESQGIDWAKLNPGDQALLETAARAQANTASQPAPAPSPATQPQPAPAAAPQPAPAQPGMTAADLIQQEFAAKQANAPQPPQPLQGGHPAARIVPKGNVPVRPPLRQPEPPNVPSAPEAAAVQHPPAPSQSPAEAVAPPPASGSGGQAIPEQVVYRSTKQPDEGISLNNQGMLYTSPDEAYSKNFGPHTQKLVIAPKNTLDLSKAFAADEGITAERMKAFMERNGVSVSEELMRNFHAAEGAGGEALQHFGQFGQKRLVSALQAAGYDSAKIPEYVEGGGKSVSTILFDKSLARPARTLPQVEAAMAQKAPAPLEAPTSRYTSTGEKKSPQLRAAEITGANAEAKAMRFAEALDKYDISPEDARQIQTGRVSNDQIGKGAAPKWENVTDDLVAKGLLPAGEKPPVQSLPIIVKQLKRIRSERIARELADEMSKSGTSK